MTYSLFDIAESLGDSLFSGESPRAYRHKVETNQPLMREIKGVATLMEHARDGSRRAAFELAEALTTSDLTRFASGALIDREMLANYTALPTQWGKFFTPTSTASFKPKYLSTIELGGQVFKDVPEGTPYQMAAPGVLGEYPVQVKKTGLLWGFTFEAGINDDLDQLMAVPNAFPRNAVDTEDDRALRLIVDPTTGALNTTFFNAPNGNVGTLKLTVTDIVGSINNLQTVYTNLTGKRDPKTGGFLAAGAQFQIMCSPAMAFTIRRVLSVNALENAAATGNSRALESNPVAGLFDVVVNEKMVGTSWVVMPKPGSSRRPAFLFAKLRGHEAPEFRYQNNGGTYIGGGAVPITEGSFGDDTRWYRGRHILGVAYGDAALTYGSDNTGA